VGTSLARIHRSKLMAVVEIVRIGLRMRRNEDSCVDGEVLNFILSTGPSDKYEFVLRRFPDDEIEKLEFPSTVRLETLFPRMQIFADNRIRITAHQSEDVCDREIRCPICLGNYEHDDEVAETRCGHRCLRQVVGRTVRIAEDLLILFNSCMSQGKFEFKF